MENRVYSVASKVYELLGDGEAREIDGFDNSYGEMIDKRFEPQIKYLDKRAILGVTYFIDKNILWLSLDCWEESEVHLEMSTEFSEENIKELVEEFVQAIKKERMI